MKRRGPRVFVLGGAALAAAVVAGQRIGSIEISLLHEGVAVELPAATGASLASSVVAYFETCRTYQAVTGETPTLDSLLETWREQRRGSHAFVTVEGAQGESTQGPQQLLVGFSPGSPAWPVLSRDPQGLIVLYSKCDGLQGSLLACDVGELVPGAAPRDCERLREIQPQGLTGEKSAG